MPFKVRLSAIPFFKYVTPAGAKDLIKSLKLVTKNKGEEIVVYGEMIPGLYIIARGNIEIYTEGYKTLLASFGSGSVIGEMSLIEDLTSSASIRASEDNTKLIFCDRELLKKQLANDFVFAAAFYKGSSIIMSQRLRKMNIKIEDEIEKEKQLVSQLIEGSELFKKIKQTRKALDKTGEEMIKKIMTHLPIIDEIIEKEPSNVENIRAMKKDLETILTIDTQNFDIIGQQIDQINRYIKNIERIISNEDAVSDKGGKNLFSLYSSVDNVVHEDAVTFF